MLTRQKQGDGREKAIGYVEDSTDNKLWSKLCTTSQQVVQIVVRFAVLEITTKRSKWSFIHNDLSLDLCVCVCVCVCGISHVCVHCSFTLSFFSYLEV